jgi:AcrR family transcriptional regulator
MKTAPRPYRMSARADAAAATRRSIEKAFLEAFAARPYTELTLDLLAAQAGVSAQTVIRQFGSKDGLFAAVARHLATRVAAEREAAPAGDIPAAMRQLVAHYEELGDVVVRLLAEEDRLPALREMADGGRAIHYDWVERVFGPGLTARRRAQLVALTDVYVWKLLRRDQRLGRRATEEAMTEMVVALMP